MAASLFLLLPFASALAQDGDGDGLTDYEEGSAVWTVPLGDPQELDQGTNDSAAPPVDMDGDGDLDVLVGDEYPGGDVVFAWLENRLNEPTEDFKKHSVTGDGSQVRVLMGVDLDGDGDPDVATGGRGSVIKDIRWYENRLNEPSADIVERPVIAEWFHYADSIDAADFDSDGDFDLVVGWLLGDKVAWYENRLNEPSADFGPENVISLLADAVQRVRAVDFDGDGAPDVLSASPLDSKLAWYRNRLAEPAADFGPQQLISGSAAGAFDAYPTDLDRDGDPDVVAALRDDDSCVWYENRLDEPTADFGPAHVISSALDEAIAVSAADLDSDGDDDVLCSAGLGAELAIFENRLDEASADFGPLVSMPQPNMRITGARGGWIGAADLDGDGNRDVLATADRMTSSEWGLQLDWYRHPGTSPIDADTDDDGVSDGDEVNVHGSDPFDPDTDNDGLSDGEEVGFGTDLTSSDTDGDGLRDGWEIDHGFDPLIAGEGSLDPDLDGATNLIEQGAGTDPFDPDSDDDGLLDGAELVPSDGTRFEPVARRVSTRWGAWAGADLDGDGDVDVASDGAYNWNENRVLEPEGDFGEERLQLTGGTANAKAMVAADLDGDGDPDLLGTSGDAEFVWHENRRGEPATWFITRAIGLAASEVADVAAADADGDGDLDAFAAWPDEGKLTWHENRLDEPSNDFGPEGTVSATAGNFDDFAAVDLDGDGDADVLLASGETDTVGWFENRLDEASNDFAPLAPISAAASAVSTVDAADVDGDGDPDVLAGLDGTFEFIWFENRLDEASNDFGPSQPVASGAGAGHAFAPADLDGDGDPDVLWGRSRTISWIENRLDEPTNDFAPSREVDYAIDFNLTGIAAHDINGDGRLDIVASSDWKVSWQTNRGVYWYPNGGTDPLDPDPDGDGLSDFAEVTVWGTDPWEADSDNDGLNDGEEVLTYGSDPSDYDSDDDGLPDGDEVMVWGTDPLDSDSDGDSLSDGNEVYFFGTHPALYDTDGDGYNDGWEITDGTNPLDPSSHPIMSVPSLGPFSLGVLAALIALAGGIASRSRSTNRF